MVQNEMVLKGLPDLSVSLGGDGEQPPTGGKYMKKCRCFVRELGTDQRRGRTVGGPEALRGVVYGLELDDLEAPSHRRKLEHHSLAHAPSDQRFPNR